MQPDDLRKYRKRHGFSQDDLARLLDVRQATISHWETGKNKIPPYLRMTLKGLEQALRD